MTNEERAAKLNAVMAALDTIDKVLEWHRDQGPEPTAADIDAAETAAKVVLDYFSDKEAFDQRRVGDFRAWLTNAFARLREGVYPKGYTFNGQPPDGYRFSMAQKYVARARDNVKKIMRGWDITCTCIAAWPGGEKREAAK